MVALELPGLSHMIVAMLSLVRHSGMALGKMTKSASSPGTRSSVVAGAPMASFALLETHS